MQIGRSTLLFVIPHRIDTVSLHVNPNFFRNVQRCGPCRAMAPVFEALSFQYTDVVFVKVDIDKAPGVKNLLSVWALPTFAFVRHGRKISSFTGANERSLRQGLDRNGELGYCASCTIA